MQWGEVWTVAGAPGYAGKPRPAVVLQNDLYLGTAQSTLSVCSPLTPVKLNLSARWLIRMAATASAIGRFSWWIRSLPCLGSR